MRKGSLCGVRVVDLTSVMMGPLATQIMADHGADVIKVESAAGDTTRHLAVGKEPGMSASHLNINRGKRSLCIDLKRPTGRAALLRVAATADVFIHAMRADAIARLGLTYADLVAVKPDIVYANAYGYSRRGPYAGRPAYDDVIQGESGMAMLQARLTGTPGYVASVVADKVTGLTVLYTVLMALFHRARCGAGQEVEVGMFEAMAAFTMAEHMEGALYDPPIGPPVYQRTVSKDRRPFRTKDGYISAMIYNDRQFENFRRVAGDPEWARDPRFATFNGRSANIDEVYRRTAETLLTRRTDEWLPAMQAAGVPAVRLNTPEELLEDPHLRAVGFFEPVETEAGRLRYPGIPAWFSATPGEITAPGAALGAHSQAVLAEAGLDAAEIAELVADGTVRG